MTTWPWRIPAVLAVASVAGAAVVATRFDPFTWPMRIATAIPCGAMVTAAVARGWHRRWSPDPAWPRPAPIAALMVWGVLIAALLAFQLLLYVGEPRQTHPTVSSLAATAFQWPGMRAVAFGLWLMMGWYLLEGGARRP